MILSLAIDDSSVGGKPAIWIGAADKEMYLLYPSTEIPAKRLNFNQNLYPEQILVSNSNRYPTWPYLHYIFQLLQILRDKVMVLSGNAKVFNKQGMEFNHPGLSLTSDGVIGGREVSSNLFRVEMGPARREIVIFATKGASWKKNNVLIQYRTAEEL